MATSKIGPRSEPPKDELIEAELEKFKQYKIDNREITIRQWPYKPGLVLSAKLVDAAKSLATSGQKTANFDIKMFLKLNLTEFITNFSELGSDALKWGIDSKRSGFETDEECIKWQDSLSMAEMVRLFTEIVKINMRPLVSALGDLKKVAVKAPSASRPVPART